MDTNGCVGSRAYLFDPHQVRKVPKFLIRKCRLECFVYCRAFRSASFTDGTNSALESDNRQYVISLFFRINSYRD
jgi:hypothetical protein